MLPADDAVASHRAACGGDPSIEAARTHAHGISRGAVAVLRAFRPRCILPSWKFNFVSPPHELGVDRENTRGNLQLKKRFSGAFQAGLGVLRCQRNGGGGRAIRPQRFCPVQNRADAAAAAVAAGGAR